MRLTKTYLYNISVGGFYQFKVFKVVDAARQEYYIGEPVSRGGTKIADTIDELQTKLNAQVALLNKYTRREK